MLGPGANLVCRLRSWSASFASLSGPLQSCRMVGPNHCPSQRSVNHVPNLLNRPNQTSDFELRGPIPCLSIGELTEEEDGLDFMAVSFDGVV